VVGWFEMTEPFICLGCGWDCIKDCNCKEDLDKEWGVFLNEKYYCGGLR